MFLKYPIILLLQHITYYPPVGNAPYNGTLHQIICWLDKKICSPIRTNKKVIEQEDKYCHLEEIIG